MKKWDFFEQIRLFLPKYLTPEQQRELFHELKAFPDNFNYYLNNFFKDGYLQGDGWKGFVAINFHTLQKKTVSGVIISNSCDIDPQNQSTLARNVLFSPLIKLSKYIELLKRHRKNKNSIISQLNDIRHQRVTRLFYFPLHSGIGDESIIVLDNIQSNPLSYFHATEKSKIFTLSQYGFYLFLIKLSIHFSRFQENVQRFD